MTSTTTLPVLLDKHAALASQLIRSQTKLQNYFRWFAKPSTRQLPPPSVPTIQSNILSLVAPLRIDSSSKVELDAICRWLASICEFIADKQLAPQGPALLKTLGSCLMPLYRSLATGRLHEGLAQSRARLSEMLALSGLIEVLDASDLIVENISGKISPSQVIHEQLQIDLSHLAYLMIGLQEGYNSAHDTLDSSATELLTGYRAGQKLPLAYQTPSWAAPQLLWSLFSDLTSNRSELMLPRSWIDTPLPWNQVHHHWESLQAAIEGHASEYGQNIATAKNERQVELDRQAAAANERQSPMAPMHEVMDRDTAIVKASQTDINSLRTLDVVDRVLQEEFSHAAVSISTAESLTQPSPAVAGPNSERLIAPQDQHAKDMLVGRNTAIPPSQHVESGVNTSAAQVTLSAAVALKSSTQNSTPALASKIVPKVLLGEITDLQDVAFAGVVRRHLANCRQDNRAVTMSMIVVAPDGESGNAALLEPDNGGMRPWQQMVINWIADNSHIDQPSAFVTRDGKLIFLAYDVDRQEAAQVVRSALDSVLTDGISRSPSELRSVKVPAIYHVGIASAMSPGPSLSHEELIESANRCLSLAQRLGKASIKSIEVY
jgi:hypothetical protein